jgi:ABC-type transport system involved in multi-copper enzyme maturation permease subunit
MSWIVAQREFLDQFKSARFIIGLVLAVSVTLGGVLIATEDYEQRLKDYNAAPEALDVGWNFPKVFRRPSPFGILARGDGTRLGNRVDISSRLVPVRPKNYSSQTGQDPFREGQDPFSESVMWSMDFVFVVKVILSLLVLFLMYDAVAGENERGTLPLVLAGSLGRGAFLTGKLLGGLISTWVMFALCALW